MKKLRLNPDALAVDTFQTVTRAERDGTVVAHDAATAPYTACFTCVTCIGVTCP